MQCWRRSLSLSHLQCRRHNSTDAVILRPYQEHCLQACTEALASGSTRIGVSLPTGAGKTTVFISLLSRISPPPENMQATRSLIIVNTIELAHQAATRVARLFPNWTVEIEQGTKHQATGTADITVATYQTLNNERRASKFDPLKLKAVIVDEAHHAAAPSYRRLLARFHSDIIVKSELDEDNEDHAPKDSGREDLKSNAEFDTTVASYEVSTLPKVPIIGFSATFGRHDGLALSSVFERIVYHRELAEMMLEEWLCKVRFIGVEADLDLKRVTISSHNGDFNPTSLAHVVNTEAINKIIVKSWIFHASQKKSTLIFCVNIAHVEALTNTFCEAGIDARSISGRTPADIRKSTIQAFKEGEFPVLLNCAILTEGADIPNIDCVMIARPTRSRNLYAQMIGRGMRLSPTTGKEDCLLMDFVDTHDRMNENLAVTPSLFGLDPNLISKSESKSQESDPKVSFSPTPIDISDPKNVTFTDYGEIFLNHLLPGSKPSHIYSLSSLAWVDCGKNLYILEVLKKGTIRLKKEGGGRFVITYNPKLGYGPQKIFMKSKEIATREDLPSAVKTAEVFLERVLLKDNGGWELAALRRSAKWRKEPATDQQQKFVMGKWTEKISPGMTTAQKKEILASLNKGNIADIITRLLNGSTSHMQRLAAAMTKKAAKEEKEKARRSRETVTVGPLPA
ncbi:Putative mitochondrial ATP-dependent helicase irc3 [Psilocybe cubensis]|uniref:P-loop containing nucleoside triphosphate hydrolase protein n=2 Tax=Psilocybe cubensis TaxID=181762 RepID=A0A8H8CPW3_PSICU|nr:Putative mitochondrial ATP-dependent helicase irc3 [Psilocybe cubensis]KAH9486984.1 Putative mitochondrial ATP-dependent helicase irc3 [Psilocybe cubensis]